VAKDKKFDVKVVISAVDNATAEFRAINKRLANSPLAKLQKSFGSLTAATGLNQVGKAFSNVGSAAKNVGEEAGALAAKIAGFGALAGAGLFSLTKNFADFGDQVKDASQRLGISTSAYQEFLGAAKLAGVEQETFNGALDKFSKFTGDAALKGSESGKIFKAMGVNMLDASGKLLPMEKILPNVISKLNTIENAQIRAAFGTKLFGKQFGELVPLIKDFEEKTAKSRQFIISEEEINRADDFVDTFNELKLVFSKVAATAGSVMLPAFKDAMGSLQTLLMDNKEGIKDFFKAIAKAIPPIIQSLVKLTKAFTAFFMMKNEAGELVVNMDRVKAVLGIIAAISVAPLVMSIVSLIGTLFTLGTTVFTTVKSVYAFFTGLKGLSFLFSVLGPALITLKGLFIAFWAAVTGPVGLVVAAIAAVIGLGVLLYKKWEPFRNLMDSIWEKIKAVASYISNSKVLSNALAVVNLPAFLAMKGINLVTGKKEEPKEQTASEVLPMTQAPLANGGVMPMTMAPELGAASMIQTINQNTTQKQEAAVTVSFDNMPQGTRVNTENKNNLDLEVLRGMSMVNI